MVTHTGVCCLRKRACHTSVLKLPRQGHIISQSKWLRGVSALLGWIMMKCTVTHVATSRRWERLQLQNIPRLEHDVIRGERVGTGTLHPPGAGGKWYDPCGKQFVLPYREPSKCSYCWLILPSRSLFQDNNKKEKELFVKVPREYCFLMVNKWNCPKQRLVAFPCPGPDGEHLRL